MERLPLRHDINFLLDSWPRESPGENGGEKRGDREDDGRI